MVALRAVLSDLGLPLRASRLRLATSIRDAVLDCPRGGAPIALTRVGDRRHQRGGGPRILRVRVGDERLDLGRRRLTSTARGNPPIPHTAAEPDGADGRVERAPAAEGVEHAAEARIVVDAGDHQGSARGGFRSFTVSLRPRATARPTAAARVG